MKKIWPLLIIFLFTFLAACSSDKETDSNNKGGEKKASAKVQKVVVGTGTQFPNICFLDKDGNLNGYDIEIVKAIDKKLPEYDFEFKTMEFSNLLLSLETKKIDLIAHQMEVNKERQEKFLFNKEPYNVFPLKVTVHQDNNEIKSIDDLAGKKVGTSPTSNSTVFLEDYKKKNNLDVELVYGASADFKEQLKTGRIDAVITTPFAVDFSNKQADAQQKVVGDTLLSSKVYFLFNKEEEKLAGRIDEALAELKKEGVISELSKKWLGADYSVDF